MTAHNGIITLKQHLLLILNLSVKDYQTASIFTAEQYDILLISAQN